MKFASALSVAIALVFCASFATAEDAKSGLPVGASIGAFDVVKVGGAVDDGVGVGTQLCYRCKNGARPQVMVFARKSDATLASLVKGLDEAVSKNSEKQLKAFVNILGADKDKAEATAKALATETKSANVPLVVPVEFENGPDNYGISPSAEVTVLLCVGGKVKANQSGALSKETVDAVLKAVSALVE
jgi:hypothetical protein